MTEDARKAARAALIEAIDAIDTAGATQTTVQLVNAIEDAIDARLAPVLARVEHLEAESHRSALNRLHRSP